MKIQFPNKIYLQRKDQVLEFKIKIIPKVLQFFLKKKWVILKKMIGAT